MSTPDEIVQAQLAEQAQTVTGDSTLADLTGDPAGAAAPPVVVDLSNATPAAADVDELQKQIEELQAKQAELAAAKAAQEAAAAEPPDPDKLVVEGSAPGWLQELVARIERRLSKLEGKSE